MFDGNNDGTIDTKDFKDVVNTLGHYDLTEDYLQDMIDRVDRQTG